MTRLIDTYGHKPSCNDAGNPPGCTCEDEAQAIMQQHVDALTERIDREGVERVYKELSIEREESPDAHYDGIVTRGRGYRVVSPEEAAARTGIDAGLLKPVHAGINAMLNDEELKAKVDAQFFRGKIADTAGFDWFMDTDIKVGVPPGSPLTAGAEQTGQIISTDGWSVPKDDDE